ncbi:MAG: prolipoprotein diacylglyceryl transferase [Rickettsiales bacterium]|jgi:phosphatidylglycerol:prolipoprotein diacylglycerol transferase|nr:prolipoprotein diacylglyceryl transferase [Rickettsiales bacterium]
MTFPGVSPVAFSLFGLPVRWYALAYIAGFSFAFAYVLRLMAGALENRITRGGLDDILSWSIIGVIAGGRLGYVAIYNPGYFAAHPLDILKIYQGGMSFHGGFLGAVGAIALWCRRNKMPVFPLLDFVAMAAPIGLFLGRVANFVNGELYGRVTSSPFGMVFPNSDGLPRHPSQLYEAALEGLALFAVLNMLYRVKAVRRRPGVIGFSFVLGYGVARAIAEIFREPDAQIGYILSLTMGQWLSVPVIIAGIAGIWIFAGKKPAARRFASSPNIDVPHVFATRLGGVSKRPFASLNCRFETSDPPGNVAENRRRVLALIGGDRLFTLNQKHTGKVVVIEKPDVNPEGCLRFEADALVTAVPGVAIGVLTADCVPVLLHDPVRKVVAAVHCGWRGIYGGIVKAAIGEMARLGSRPKDIRAALGPSLRQASYEVDEKFRNSIALRDVRDAGFFRPAGGPGREKFLFDCAGYARARLREAGVRDITVLPFDTFGEADLFFSYRRSLLTGDFAAGGPMDEGRMLSAVMLPKGQLAADS